MGPTSDRGEDVARSVATASIWVTVGMLAGRLAGIVRELLIADTFGATRDADVAILLVSGPELLVTLAGSGAVGLVLIPILLSQQPQVQIDTFRLLSVRLGVGATALGAVAATVVIAGGTGWATEGDLPTASFRVAVLLSACAVPPALLVVLSGSLLRARDRFGAVSFETVTFTLPVLVAIILSRSVVGVAVGVLVGASVRYGVQLVLIRLGTEQRYDDSVPARSVGRPEFAVSVSISVLQAAQVYLPLLLAAGLGAPGDVALLNFGWRVLLIPIGLLGSIFAVAAYPSLVRLLQVPSPSAHAVRAVLRPIILLSVGIASWIFVFASEASEALYGRTGLGEDALATIAEQLRIGAAAIPLITIGSAGTTLLFGLQRLREGVVPYALATPVVVVLGALLYDALGPTGIVLGVSAYGATMMFSASIVLSRVSGFAVLASRDGVLVTVGLAVSVAVAIVLRALLPHDGILAVALSGTCYSLLLGPLLISATRRASGSSR